MSILNGYLISVCTSECRCTLPLSSPGLAVDPDREVDAWPGEGGGRGLVRGIPFLRWSGVRAIMRPAFGHEFVLDTVLADEEWTRLRGGLSASGPFILVSVGRRRRRR